MNDDTVELELGPELPLRKYGLHFKTGPMPAVEALSPADALRAVCRYIGDNPEEFLGKSVSCWEIPS